MTFSLRKNIEFSDKFDEIQESLQTTIDVLVDQHRIMEEKSRLEVFSDDPVVKDLVGCIRQAKNSVLLTAKILDDTISVESVDEQENEAMK
jgi:hypothetical protein